MNDRVGKYAFLPYRGNDVNEEWRNLDLSRFGLGRCYLRAEKATAEEVKWTGEEYIVILLGHGSTPFLPWSRLTRKEQLCVLRRRHND